VVRILNAEKTTIHELLNDEWDSVDDLVKALMDAFFEMLEKRDFYGIRWGGLAYGPFASKASAEKISKMLDGVAQVAPLLSVSRIKGVAEAANPITDRNHCTSCTHPKFAHGFTNKRGCVVKTCDCTEVYK
jgi:hypothetical protein